ncbi:MAG: HAD family hydrolase [Candidatus Harrisonbacteria bacterium]|nr:HAD family hydrolase [Candidatus Harrisonbacteria bacterium]
MVKAFIFDLGNTLIEYPAPEKLKENCAEFAHQMKISGEILNRMHELYMKNRREGFESFREATVETALTEALQESGREVSDLEILELVEEIYHYGFGRLAVPIEGGIGLMKALKERGMKTGIISNTPLPGFLFMKDLDRFDLLQYFDDLIFSADFGKRKPSPDIFRASLRNLGVKAHEAVYTGDSLDRDVKGSQDAGMKSIWLNRKGRQEEHGGYVVSSLIQILAIKELFA